MRCRDVVTILLCASASIARADASVPPPEAGECVAPSAAVTQEIERLFASIAGHSTASQVCVDGNGHQVSIDRVRSCRAPASAGSPLTVAVSYRVTVTHLRGGECSPYPECARPSPPSYSNGRMTIRFTTSPAGLVLVLPREVPGLELYMQALDKKHETGCDGTIAAFVPRAVK